ncbi:MULTISPECIES: phage protein NinX family protein [Enterobacter]|uniref:phage protein NinX family protein n=1 Tax=Enterobacter TaxID=547 RepID=UPI002002A920|nr:MULTISPECIES: phage protein NinX family protein [Enterobacter]MCK6993091.1 DUF2591 domain-containing protein [Enterobacter asburiae]MDZ5638990.1 phage protein NinX family protein [Enterobacter sp. A103]
MDYSQLSDQEINAMVGKIVSKDGLSIIASDGNAVIHEYADCGEFKGICLGWKVFDPCHNPTDAWPIIADNHIGIAPYPSEAFAWSSRHGMASDLSAEDKNPLRAAMLVFLMMKGKK